MDRIRPRHDQAMALRGRADRLWSAKTAEDWATAYLFLEPPERQKASQEEFVNWCVNEEPFRVLSYDVQDVRVAGDVGWVNVHYRASLNKFPDAPARDAQTWEKWRRIDEMWYPVPVDELSVYPESPAKRDAAEESRLRGRFLESWAARQARAWPRLYKLTDPADRADVPEEEYAEVEGLFEYIAHEIHWVEVLGRRGRIRVSYEHRVTDPSLSKLPVMSASVIETWIRRDNEWYRDLKHK